MGEREGEFLSYTRMVFMDLSTIIVYDRTQQVACSRAAFNLAHVGFDGLRILGIEQGILIAFEACGFY